VLRRPTVNPGFLFCHPGPVSIIHPTAPFGAVSLIFSIQNDSDGPGRGQLWLLRGAQEPGSALFQEISRTPHRPPPSLRPVCFSAAAPYPVGTASAAIRRTTRQGLPGGLACHRLCVKRLRCAYLHAPRRPAGGSELSLTPFRNMKPLDLQTALRYYLVQRIFRSLNLLCSSVPQPGPQGR
jgi:hypothetical protein